MHSEAEESVVCDVCGFAKAQLRHDAKIYGKGEDLLVIENVPVISCPSCGTSYLTSATLKEIDRIKRERKLVAVTKAIEVANFSVAHP